MAARLNTVIFTVRGEPVEPPATCIEPFDKALLSLSESPGRTDILLKLAALPPGLEL